MKKTGVFIGRFQPLHMGHLHNIQEGLNTCEKLIIIIGSAKTARNSKNPFSFIERKTMLESSIDEMIQKGTLPASAKEKIFITGIRDFGDNEKWAKAVFNLVHTVAEKYEFPQEITLIGHEKDHTSFYQHYFPTWSRTHISNFDNINATDIRSIWYSGSNPLLIDAKITPEQFVSSIKDCIPHAVAIKLLSSMSLSFFNNLKDEHNDIAKYKELWKPAPYAPTFVTTDALVKCGEKVLLIKRKANPGKGLWATPGGFLNPNESLLDCAIRELYEETQIQIGEAWLKRTLVSTKVMDYPNRSLRGRTITHCFFFDLNQKDTPLVTASDDAEKCEWVLISDLIKMEDQLFEDHFQSWDHFLNLTNDETIIL